jgi:hypothetical protein
MPRLLLSRKHKLLGCCVPECGDADCMFRKDEER